MATFPIVVTSAGYQPQQPSALLAQLIAGVTATNPGYTASLPGSLIEDISSTDVYALLQMDSSVAEIINSITPYGANEFLLNELSAIYGLKQGTPTNASVYVVFSGPPGFVIAKGFTVSDGTYQYVLADGGVIGAGGASLPLFAVATINGIWAIAPGTVVQLVTSVPSSISVTVTNPLAGTTQQDVEPIVNFRARVLQAGLAASTGMARYLKTLLGNLPGVQSRLVGVRSQPNGFWEVICGGGDPYAVGNAILHATTANNLVGSTMHVVGITQANPGIVTTDLYHNFATGQIINIAGATGMTSVNNVPLTITVLSPTTFSIGVDTSSYGAYTGNGVVTPNFRNVVVSILDYPDTYSVPFINPPQMVVTMTVTWNTNLTNIINPAAVAQLGQPALVNYINSIPVGQPINLFELQAVFQASLADVIPPQNLTRMVFAVSINGVGVSPSSGTGIIAGDPESYFYAVSTGIVISQG